MISVIDTSRFCSPHKIGQKNDPFVTSRVFLPISIQPFSIAPKIAHRFCTFLDNNVNNYFLIIDIVAQDILVIKLYSSPG